LPYRLKKTLSLGDVAGPGDVRVKREEKWAREKMVYRFGTRKGY
jgi:hypothetical protein